MSAGTWGVFEGRHDFPTSPVFPGLPRIAFDSEGMWCWEVGKAKQVFAGPFGDAAAILCGLTKKGRHREGTEGGG